MNLKTRLAQLERRLPPVDEEQRQAVIASIEAWFAELEIEAETDPNARHYLEAMKEMLARPR